MVVRSGGKTRAGYEDPMETTVNTPSRYGSCRRCAYSRSLSLSPAIRALSLLTVDPLVGSHLDALVGHRYGRRRIEFHNVVFSLIYVMQNVTGDLEFTDDRFDEAWANFIGSLEVRRIPMKTVAVIPYLELPSPPVQLDHQLTLDVLTDDEVTRCERLGILRTQFPDFPMIMSHDAVGIRRNESQDKILGGELEPIPSEVDHFGKRNFLNPHMMVDDVMCLLRLFKPCALKCAGHVSYTDWKWLAGGSTVHVAAGRAMGSSYEISVSDHEVLRTLWQLLIRESDHFDFALRRFSLAFDRESIGDRLVDLVVAAESLFLGDIDVGDRGELRFRFALRAAWFIEHPSFDGRTTFAMMRRAYDARSAIVHGGTPRDIRVPGNESSSIADFTLCLAEFVRLALQKALLLAADGINLRRGDFWANLVLPT